MGSTITTNTTLRKVFLTTHMKVLGVGFHTEEDDVAFVVHRPLYPETPVYVDGRFFDIRPLELWMSKVTIPGRGGEVLRYSWVANPERRAMLAHQSRCLYPPVDHLGDAVAEMSR